MSTHEHETQGRPLYLVPFGMRVWHWLNAALFLVLIATGFSLHFAAPGAELIGFATARWLHNAAGIALAVTYAFFVVAMVWTVNWPHYLPRGRDFPIRLIRQALFYGNGYVLRASRTLTRRPKRPSSIRCSW